MLSESKTALETLGLEPDRTHIMGVLNVTPDSFSDGGLFNRLDAALAQAKQMAIDGATIIDVGGESTRPGAEPVGLQEELDRVCPVVEKVVVECNAVVSVDTSCPEVMGEVIKLGAGMINDVRAFSRPSAINTVKSESVALCLMHMQGNPATMQNKPRYNSVVSEVSDFLSNRANELIAEGIAKERLLVDPGFGFGKSLDHNLQLLKHIEDVASLGYPVLVGLSRKSMFEKLLGRPVDERLFASIAAAVVAAQHGASIVRVHDVAETADAIRVVDAMRRVD